MENNKNLLSFEFSIHWKKLYAATTECHSFYSCTILWSVGSGQKMKRWQVTVKQTIINAGPSTLDLNNAHVLDSKRTAKSETSFANCVSPRCVYLYLHIFSLVISQSLISPLLRKDVVHLCIIWHFMTDQDEVNCKKNLFVYIMIDLKLSVNGNQ